MENFEQQLKEDGLANLSRARNLFFILIITCLVSTASLVLYRMADGYFRDQLYYATEANLPRHKPAKTPYSTFQEAEKGGGEAETKNWKTYRNEKFGFEIKYPDNWYISEEVDNLHLFLLTLLPNGQLYEGYPNLSYEVKIEKNATAGYVEWFNKYYNRHINQPVVKPIKFNNKTDAFQVSELETAGGCSGEQIQIYLNNKVFILPNPECWNSDMVDKISSTFRFN